MAAEKHKGVRTRHKDYDKYDAKWKRCRDVMDGQDAIHAAGECYLPKLNEQTPDNYKAYVMRAGFYNASWRTVAGLSGMMFRKPPAQKVPTSIEEYLKDVTMGGVAFNQFAQNVATDVLEVGRIGIMVDHPEPPKVDGEITVATAEAFGLRPTMQSYEAEAIINWKFRKVKNQNQLCMVVLSEECSLPDGEFGETYETRYRVLDLTPDNEYRVRVFRVGKSNLDELVDNAEVYPLMNGKRLNYIPFVFIGPDGTEAKLDEPPLIDLFDANLSHYRTTADYEHGVHFSALPTFFISGYTQPTDEKGMPIKIYLGSQSAICLPDPAARAGFAEITSSFQAHRAMLDAKKQEMATLGARMLADASTRQVETFGATAIKHVAENSILAAIAIAVSKGLLTALNWFAAWGGAGDDACEYDINRDFLPIQMDAPTLTALIAALQGGLLSEAEVFDILKRGDAIESDKTLEEHQAEIDAAPPPAPPSNTSPGRLGTMSPEEQIAHDKAKADAMPKPVMKAAA